MNFKQNIIIASARRSGTHLLTDLIVNNFGYERIDNSIDFDELTDDNFHIFYKTMLSGGKIAWTHCHDYDTLFYRNNLSEENIYILRKLFSISKIIYIYRDIRDVMTSCYNRPHIKSKYSDFNEFYHNDELKDYKLTPNNFENETDFATILINQQKNWLSVYFARDILELEMEIITFEDIINNYISSINKISKFLNVNYLLCTIKDVRLKSFDDTKDNITYTYNDFYKGIIGEWKNTFGESWGAEIKHEYDKKITQYIDSYNVNQNKERGSFNDTVDYINEYNLIIEEIKKFPAINYPNIELIINYRYNLCQRKTDDVRFKHKIFYLDDKILKLFKSSEINLNKEYLNILRSYNNDTIPTLYHVGIHNNMLVTLQKKHEG